MILLDTHVWLWWLHDPSQLSARAVMALRDGETRKALRVSSISVWEIALKAESGKLVLPMDVFLWFEQARRHPGIVIETLDPLDAIGSTRLPGAFHKDPADRILVAMARRKGATLVTCDEKILAYPHVKTLW